MGSSSQRKTITNGEFMGQVLEIKWTEKLMLYILVLVVMETLQVGDLTKESQKSNKRI